MALGSAQEIIDLCQSSNTALVDRQLIVARGLVDDILLANGLTTPASNNTLSYAVNNLACALIASAPGELDPRSNYKVDGFQRSDGNESQPDYYFSTANKWIGQYLALHGKKYNTPLGISVVGSTGRRIGEYEEQS
jgi:hypothetical protein